MQKNNNNNNNNNNNKNNNSNNKIRCQNINKETTTLAGSQYFPLFLNSIFFQCVKKSVRVTGCTCYFVFNDLKRSNDIVDY